MGAVPLGSGNEAVVALPSRLGEQIEADAFPLRSTAECRRQDPAREKRLCAGILRVRRPPSKPEAP